MKRTITIQVEFNWNDYDDVSDEVLIDDWLRNANMDGVTVKTRKSILVDIIKADEKDGIYD